MGVEVGRHLTGRPARIDLHGDAHLALGRLLMVLDANLGERQIDRFFDDAIVADVTRGLEAVVKVMRQKAPAATIIVTGIFPRNDNAAVFQVISRINRNLAAFADGRKVRFLNVNDKLADANGNLFAGMMNTDKLHPALKGYDVWAAGLKPMFQELLGSPASQDAAPPPTGDPSAKR